MRRAAVFDAARRLHAAPAMRKLAFALLLGATGCDSPPYSSGPPADIVGPFPGTTQRFVIDQLVLPMERSDYAADLNGDGKRDNSLGNIANALASQNDLTLAAGDMLAAGVLTPVLEVTADDPSLRDSSAPVGVRFRGADGEPADEMGATLRGGYLESNRTRSTTHPAALTLHLPLWADADPTVVPVVGAEIELSADGHGGFYGKLHGGISAASALDAAYPGFVQQVLADPASHEILIEVLDHDRDGKIALDEFRTDPLMESVLAPDVQLFTNGDWAPSPGNKAKDSLSFGLAFHAAPCASGRCATAAPANHCDDRVRDGDETDVDCGGGCRACPAGAACATAADCQTPGCDAGRCIAPTCSDGVRDGFERGIDCGHGCLGCPGDPCANNNECKSGLCLFHDHCD